jgi:hypothetical protein
MRDVEELVLCKECAAYLVNGAKNQTKSNVWPSFIWKMLMNASLFHMHGIGLWAYVPDVWRQWWVRSLTNVGGTFAAYQNITIMNPPPIF